MTLDDDPQLLRYSRQILLPEIGFEGQSRLARQRAVNALLKAELSGPVHALSVKALTPGEAQAGG